MVGKRLNQYRGELTPEELVQGINVAKDNSARLVQDAKTLLELERYPSAFTLGVLAIEEFGKASILKRLALCETTKDVRAAWKEYRSHTAKNSGWIFAEIAAKGGRYMSDFKKITEPGAEHTHLLEQLKQVSLYTDCLGDEKRWSEPSKVITKELAKEIVSIAELNFQLTNKDTEETIELWIEIVRPLYGKSGMIEAVLEFQRVMHERGLTDVTPDQLKEFMVGKPL